MCEISFFTCKESEPISTKNVIHDTKKNLMQVEGNFLKFNCGRTMNKNSKFSSALILITTWKRKTKVPFGEESLAL